MKTYAIYERQLYIYCIRFEFLKLYCHGCSTITQLRCEIRYFEVVLSDIGSIPGQDRLINVRFLYHEVDMLL